jgi:hypothetical protein
MRYLQLAACLLIPAFAGANTLTGTAKNSDGEIIYIETHQIQKDDSNFNKLIKVEYKKPNGQTFATMTSDFTKNKFVPDTEFEDQRFNSKHTLRMVDKTVEFAEFKGGVRISNESLPLKNNMVASQGFDNYIRAHTKKLALEPQSFKFGVLNKMTFYSLTGYAKAAPSNNEVEYGINTSNWFLRLFVRELRVIYDAKSVDIKSYIGRSNILTDKGDSQYVSISYDWKKGS